MICSSQTIRGPVGGGGGAQSARQAAGGARGSGAEVGLVEPLKAQPLSINPLAARAIHNGALTLHPLRTRYSVDRGAL